MTIYQIEVRAISERYDVHAQQLAREIVQLPAAHLPSLSQISEEAPLHLRTAHIYRLRGTLTVPDLDRLTQQLLIDPVVQKAWIASDGHVEQQDEDERVVDVFFHAGVTDTLAESVMTGARMIGIVGLEGVETGQRYRLDARLSEEETHYIAQALLYNSIIQHYSLTALQSKHITSQSSTPLSTSSLSADSPLPESIGRQTSARTIAISQMNDEQLLEVSRTGLLSLQLDEMRTIQQHYREQGREPTDVELETLAQTWSEHCSHKTFKAVIQYREVDSRGRVVAEETIPGLLKRYIMQATSQLKPDWLVSAFSDNAGIIRLNETHDIAFKVETHNHPSAIEPFGGANTGVGGVIRDILGVSAQPIACTDVLCFGPQEAAVDTLPPGILSPRRIAAGVVAGVRDYGNKMGIPTVNGAVLYSPGYIFNPLVFCGCLGLLPHGSHPRKLSPGDLIVALGGRTGRDGIHGATFSSGEMSLEINTQAGAAVQIGAPITEKKVSDVIMQAREQHLYSAITDCGAGGFSSAIGEMGAETGARIALELAPLKYQGLLPWEIWLSEAQERMILAVPPDALGRLLEICTLEEVEATVLGSFTDDHRLTLTYNGEVVADMDMTFLHDGLPRKTLQAVWKQQVHTSHEQAAQHAAGESRLVQNIQSSFAPTLLSLLRHPNIATKEAIVRRYDHEVQGATIGKPLVGRSGNGPGDAAVLQPYLDNWNHITNSTSSAGIVLSNGVNPLYGKIDPYAMALNAVDEALRNLTAVGGDITRAALLDNFCWGNPTDPEQLGMLVRAVKGCYDAALGFRTPFISGKDSLNNEYRTEGRRIPVLPTLLISAVGVIADAAKTVDMALKTPGNQLYLVGQTRYEMAGTHYAEVIDPDSFAQLFPLTEVPQVDIPRAFKTMKVLGETIRNGFVRSCHDLSEGGLAVAVAEMALAGQLGVTLNIQHVTLKQVPTLHPNAETIVRLFSETPSRFLVEITPEQLGGFQKYLLDNDVRDITHIGTITTSDRFIVNGGEDELINLSIHELQEAWKGEKE